MGTTKAQVINDAIQLLGGYGIQALAQKSRFQESAETLYQPLVESKIAATAWRFATKQIQLSQLSVNPYQNYQYAYRLPGDYLALWRLYPNAQTWEIYGNILVSNLQGLYMDYRYCPSESQWNSAFARYISAALASTLALEVARNPDIQKAIIENELTPRFNDAAYIDSSSRPNTSLFYADAVLARSY